METLTGREGTFVLSWSQTEIDGHANASDVALVVGAYWRWTGAAVDLGVAANVPPRSTFQSTEAFRRHSARAARSVVGQALGLGPACLAPKRDDSFTLSDGRRDWVATLLDVDGLARPLIMFAGSRPPADTPLKIVQVETRRGPLVLKQGDGVVCFTPGTQIETPTGPLPVEWIVAGDKVVTLDGGAQEVLWIGSRRLSLRDLRRTPDLAPVRIRAGALTSDRETADLIVSPDHRVLVQGGHGDRSEVLVAARDLVNDDGIARMGIWNPVTYIHLLLEHHHILVANGVETESFHPGTAALDSIAESQRLRLFDVMPCLATLPESYGPAARPILSSAESSLLSAA